MAWFACQPLAPMVATTYDRHSHRLSPLSASPHPFRVGGNRPLASSFCSTLPSPPSPTAGSYDDALIRLSSLISRRVRGDDANRWDRFDLMSQYLRILELDGPISRLKVIHVAGTKGKGSTCSFTESILRNYGFRTGLFTSPHLIDVRERFRLEGAEISEEKFLEHFWWCWSRLQEKTDDKVPMPAYFRFLALLAFKIFTEEQVDVAILEVGLGGKFDATNVVKAPIVCGISSLGYDHMEILGNTLAEIAGEKAGIFKENVPAYTVPQPEEAMKVLDCKAFQLGIPLLVAPPLDVRLLNGQKLGLDGEHQFLNAGLAISLCHSWLKAIGHSEIKDIDGDSVLPEKFIRGLAMTKFPGRAQVVQDPHVCVENFSDGGLIFYLDGAHSPESMETCAKWFSNIHKKGTQQLYTTHDEIRRCGYAKNILLFNCMSVRDPELLLSRLLKVCADHGIYFNKAIFVPNQSVYNKVGSFASDAHDSHVDLSWQQTLQRVWQKLVYGGKDSRTKHDMIIDFNHERKKDASVRNIICRDSSSIFSSLPSAIKWIRNAAQQNQAVRFQVLVTGSLHLVGDVLKLIKK